MRLNDYLLLMTICLSVAAGLFLPGLGIVFAPYLSYYLMFILFLSFLPIRPQTIMETVRGSAGLILTLSLVKMLILPVAIYYLFRLIWPQFAMGALLLSAISTGVVAPFISSLVGGNTALVLALVVITSPLAPVTVPALVKILAGRHMELPFGGMVLMLGQVIFIPMAAVELCRRFSPGAAAFFRRRSFPFSLTLFFVINFAVFAKYSSFFRQQPAVLLTALAAAFILGGLFVAAGLLLKSKPVDDRLAAATIFGNMNNVLVIVFGSQFFGPLEPTLAAMYMFPFFSLIIPLRLYRRRVGKNGDVQP